MVRFTGAIGAGILYIILVAQQVGKIYGTITWPVTYQMIEILNGSFGLFMLVIIAFYAGELVWAERDAKMEQITDATPLPNATTFLAKLTALVEEAGLESTQRRGIGDPTTHDPGAENRDDPDLHAGAPV